ncbi:Nuclease-related domain-containing protein [Desulfocicer vacuolatum DSM 3385]|uniref:Nuclease-related domain-containing protein n=1 Tax=Desulfocicer vacuolatum DSM 3385 TaxID=1121400 RepID=A0A1W2DWS5_9BACT|nr:nuclease-related domain-containing protein [Desulfocicer vacuolatum]SMD01572.1 Nuclease-related domain-containing protein [Desulfocicer vacuolatum DSM 3385]
MIIKETDKKKVNGKFQQFGYDAEKQMAYYLMRAFEKDKVIRVINDLRLEKDGVVAQIDHLIIHSFGFIIIESKSVTTEVSVNEHGEWARYFNNKPKGMPSPVNQAIRQADLLKQILMENNKDIMKKTIIGQGSSGKLKYDVLVAISDSGIIKRGKNVKQDEVLKADQITDKIEKTIEKYERENNKLFSLKMNMHLSDESLTNISKFLCKSHKPLGSSSKSPEPMQYPKRTTPGDSHPVAMTSKENPKVQDLSTNQAHCLKCNSQNIKIAYGKYGYYFKCLDCDGNTGIKLKCKDNSCKPRLRKSKLLFFKECAVCGTSELFFENPE